MSTHWTKEQQDRLATLIDQGAWLGYWCTDENGDPVDRVRVDPVDPKERVLAGLVQRSDAGYFATKEAHRRLGTRVWVVALSEILTQSTVEALGRVREIVGEIVRDDAIDPSVGVRLGVKDLRGISLRGADLRRCDLRGADMRDTDLMAAQMRQADLTGADLRGARLLANLADTILTDANLAGAQISGALFRGAVGRDDWPDLVARGAVR